MKKKARISLLFLLVLAVLSQPETLIAEDNDDHKHDHVKENNHENTKDKEEHGEHEDEHSDEHDEIDGEKFGPDKAILEVKNQGQLFKLSITAEQVMEIKSLAVVATEKDGYFKVPQSSIVEYQDKVGVYRQQKQWYELLNVTITQANNNEVLIFSEALKTSDQVVVSGLGLLRVAHLEASGQGGKGHAH